MDDAIFLLGLVGVPLLVGAIVGYLRRPWWWAAVLAVVTFLLLAIVPAPEQGESRVEGGDLIFLLVACLIVAGLAWVGAYLGRWLARRRVATHKPSALVARSPRSRHRPDQQIEDSHLG